MYSTLEFDLGRNALRYVIRTFNIKKLHIPYYLCDVVRHMLVEENCKPLFYHINNDFYPSKEFLEEDYILYPNYWGICGNNVKKLVNKYPNLIVDNAHAFYDIPKGFACFNAGHKFGYNKSILWVKNINNKKYIEKTKFKNQTEFCINNALKRKEIFLELHSKYKTINMLKIDLSSNPFVYPCLTKTTEEADALVSELKEEGKTVYRYWNNLPKSYLEYKFYSKLVPVPIML